jgi:nicotinamidase-related amidase
MAGRISCRIRAVGVDDRRRGPDCAATGRDRRPEDSAGAFSTTDLDERLRAPGVDTLVLAGIGTSGVVLSTVCDAADRDYRLYVLSDACADHDPEVHATLCEKVFPKHAYVVATDRLTELLEVS